MDNKLITPSLRNNKLITPSLRKRPLPVTKQAAVPASKKRRSGPLSSREQTKSREQQVYAPPQGRYSSNIGKGTLQLWLTLFDIVLFLFKYKEIHALFFRITVSK